MLAVVGGLGIIGSLQNRKNGHAILWVCVTPLKYCVPFWLC